MKIEVGGYVRTKDKILKVDSFEKDNRNIKCVCFTTGEIYTLELLDEITVKHSKNIIDLIEVGDYVNGYRVLAIEDSIYKNSKRILIYKNNKEKYERWMYIQEYDGKIHTQDDIVEILTKEQYKANCYTVERNE